MGRNKGGALRRRESVRKQSMPSRGSIRRRMGSIALHAEVLEARQLLSAYTLNQVLSQYDAGAKLVAQAKLADAALGSPIKLLAQSLSQELGLSNDLATPFNLRPGLTSTWSAVASLLQNDGFGINVPFTGAPDANGNLLEVTWAKSYTAPINFVTTGQTGFNYLDNGFLGGTLSGSDAHVAVGITFGVKLQAGVPTFFIADGSPVQVGGWSATGSLSGSISIGSLADVSAQLTAVLSVSQASLDFKGVHVVPNSGKVSGTIGGTLKGALSIGHGHGDGLTASLDFLPDITWSPTFDAPITTAGLGQANFNLNPPSVSSLLSGLGQKLFSLGGDLLSPGDGVPLLGPLNDALNAKIPVIDKSIADITGFSSDLPSFPTDPATLSGDSSAGIIAVLNQYGVMVNGGQTSGSDLLSMAQQLVQGSYTGDLFSWSASKSVSLTHVSYQIPIVSLGVPDVASAEIDANFSFDASLEYSIGFGINTRGFWFKTGNPSAHTLSLTFTVAAGLEGQVEVFGFPLADAGGDLTFSVQPYIDLTAPDGGGRVYASDLAEFGSNPFTDVLDALNAGIQGTLGVDAYASIDLFFFSVSWNWSYSVPVFDFQKTAAWPRNLPGGAVSPFTFSNGQLTYSGTSGNDHVAVSEDSNGTVTTTVMGKSQTWTGVKQFNFTGGGGNDQLTVANGFNIPVRADVSAESSTNKSYIQTGDAGGTLIGGAGSDTLMGGSGNDSITAGSGPATIIGGDGHDTLTGGSGTAADAIYAGANDSTLIGTGGNDSLFAGGGNDVIWGGSGAFLVEGGTGNDTIYGRAKNGAPSTAATAPVIHAGSGKSTIFGGSVATQIFGDGGSITVTGGSGQDTIHGGTAGDNWIQGSTSTAASGNLIYGGGDGDTLVGGNGNNTIFGGDGNETLYGGDGLLLTPPQSFTGPWQTVGGDGRSAGNNILVAGTGNDLIFGDSHGHNILRGGPGRDTLFAGSGGNDGVGDYLSAGSGLTTLYGSNGNDSFELPFSPGTQSPADVVFGGPGTNRLVVNPVNPGPGNLASPITSTTATTITVTNGADITPAQWMSKAGYYIQIDGEEMLVTNVVGNAITVTRRSAARSRQPTRSASMCCRMRRSSIPVAIMSISCPPERQTNTRRRFRISLLMGVKDRRLGRSRSRCSPRRTLSDNWLSRPGRATTLFMLIPR